MFVGDASLSVAPPVGGWGVRGVVRRSYDRNQAMVQVGGRFNYPETRGADGLNAEKQTRAEGASSARPPFGVLVYLLLSVID